MWPKTSSGPGLSWPVQIRHPNSASSLYIHFRFSIAILPRKRNPFPSPETVDYESFRRKKRFCFSTQKCSQTVRGDKILSPFPFLGLMSSHAVTRYHSLQNSLVPVFPQSYFRGQVLLGTWKISQFHRRLRFPPVDLEKGGSRLKIRADATNELKPSVWKDSGSNNLDSETYLLTDVELNEAWEGLDEKEKLRRMRIPKANKGSTPGNKGMKDKKHIDETRKRIRERTRIAMQDPKVRMKLINFGHAQSKETRSKIAVGVRMGWARRREILKLQDACYFEGQNLVAEASRKGLLGEDELQWDSYEVLVEQFKREWAEQRKTMSKWPPKSPEQRKKIAAAIAAKWADPEYRELVSSGLAKYHACKQMGDGKEAKEKPR